MTQKPIVTVLHQSGLRGWSPLGSRVSANSHSGKGKRHYLSQSILESCVDEVFTHSRVFTQKRIKEGMLEMGLLAAMREEGPVTLEARKFRGHFFQADAEESSCEQGPS